MHLFRWFRRLTDNNKTSTGVIYCPPYVRHNIYCVIPCPPNLENNTFRRYIHSPTIVRRALNAQENEYIIIFSNRLHHDYGFPGFFQVMTSRKSDISRNFLEEWDTPLNRTIGEDNFIVSDPHFKYFCHTGIYNDINDDWHTIVTRDPLCSGGSITVLPPDTTNSSSTAERLLMSYSTSNFLFYNKLFIAQRSNVSSNKNWISINYSINDPDTSQDTKKDLQNMKWEVIHSIYAYQKVIPLVRHYAHKWNVWDNTNLANDYSGSNDNTSINPYGIISYPWLLFPTISTNNSPVSEIKWDEDKIIPDKIPKIPGDNSSKDIKISGMNRGFALVNVNNTSKLLTVMMDGEKANVYTRDLPVFDNIINNWKFSGDWKLLIKSDGTTPDKPLDLSLDQPISNAYDDDIKFGEPHAIDLGGNKVLVVFRNECTKKTSGIWDLGNYKPYQYLLYTIVDLSNNTADAIKYLTMQKIVKDINGNDVTINKEVLCHEAPHLLKFDDETILLTYVTRPMFDANDNKIKGSVRALIGTISGGVVTWAEPSKLDPGSEIMVPANVSNQISIVGGIIDGEIDEPGMHIGNPSSVRIEETANILTVYNRMPPKPVDLPFFSMVKLKTLYVNPDDPHNNKERVSSYFDGTCLWATEWKLS